MSFDLTNKNISDTYQNLLQKTGSEGHLYDLTGNKVDNLTIGGTLTAHSYITSESVVNTSSGSTAFGNTADDSHTFIGDITASGNISASSTSTGSFGHIFTEGTSYLGTTAAGTYKAGGNVFIGSELTVGGSNVGYGVYLNGTPGWGAGYWFDTDNGCGIYGAGSNKDYMRFRVSPDNVTIMELTNHDVTINGHITASGNISAGNGIVLGGITRTTWPSAGSVGDWYDAGTTQTSSKDVIVDGFISASSLEVDSVNATDDFFLLKSGSLDALKLNNEGVLQLGAFTFTPTAVSGGIYYDKDDDEFYLGKNN